MRIWDVPVDCLCDRHLLGEHAELHAVWNILTGDKEGYSRHPETLRWRGKLAALHSRHEREVAEFARRGFRHRSPLDEALATGATRQDELLQPFDEQLAILRGKGCACPLPLDLNA